MENQFNEPGMIIEPSQVEVLPFKDVQEYLKRQASEFTFSPLEYIPGPDDKKQTVFLKIANIMGDLDRIPKSGYNKAHDYNYVTESDVVGAVRPLMAKQKLIMMPSIKTYKQEDVPTKYSKLYMGTVEIEWIVRDAESYEQVKFTMIGKGTDTLEKDIYKAISGNKKYALISLFMIDSGDDPERNDSPTQGRELDDHSNQKNAQKGQGGQKGLSGGNGRGNNQKSNAGQSGKNQTQSEPPETKQPTKGDLVTRWMVLDTSEKSPKDKRVEFDAWYSRQAEKGWDHLAMIQALTKKIQEKNEAEKKAEKENKTPDGQDGQAGEKDGSK